MMSRAGSSRQKRRTRGLHGTTLGLLAAGLGVVVVVAMVVVYDHAWVARNRADPNDPSVRVGGAIRSISGSEAVRRVRYDPATRTARVEATSKYYDATKPLKENQEYLATEGRLGAQLALYENRAVDSVTVLLYHDRDLLATVTAGQGQVFAQMKVEYSGRLAER
jgi:hypothetical protein